jgi:hypothetical protein
MQDTIMSISMTITDQPCGFWSVYAKVAAAIEFGGKPCLSQKELIAYRY